MIIKYLTYFFKNPIFYFKNTLHEKFCPFYHLVLINKKPKKDVNSQKRSFFQYMLSNLIEKNVK